MGEVEMAIDIDESKIARLLNSYVVCTFAGEKADPYEWLFWPDEEMPRPVPNRSMHWRRPTFGELVIRQVTWRLDPERFEDRYQRGVVDKGRLPYAQENYRWGSEGRYRRLKVWPNKHEAEEYLRGLDPEADWEAAA